MPLIVNKKERLPLQTLALAAFVVFMSFIWQGNKGFNMADEGFLWYGSQRVTLGEVPIRDFFSYDPGRYYYSAALMRLWGDNGIMSLRVAAATFQVIGLFVGLFLIARSMKKQNPCYLRLSVITLALWMFPYFKMFDISLSIILIGVLAFLVNKPTSRNYFYAGLCIGLAAVFGRNHGVYGLAGCIGVMLWISIKRVEGPGLIKGLALWVAGITVGFTPILFMALLVPGFAVAFRESVCFMFEVKATNLSLPIPWPWLVKFSSTPIEEAIRGVMLGLFFIATVVFGVLSIIWVIWRKLQNKQVSPALVAASFLALPYAHYAYSRADVEHLCLGIFPLLVGCLVLLATQADKVKWPLAITLCLASICVMFTMHPGWQCNAGRQWVNIEISGNNLMVAPDTANDIRLLRNLSDQYARDDKSFIATPFWPSAYALLERKSPMWDIYVLWPRSRSFEQTEIERIKKTRPGFALIFDLPLEGHDELRFKNSRPLIYKYILEHFERLPDSSNPSYQIYRAKENAQ